MSRPEHKPQLTDLQLSILRALWRAGELSVSEVHGRLTGDRDLAPTTVATLLKRLEKRGVVTHRIVGRQFVYAATVSEDEATQSMLAEVTERLFAGDVPEMMSQLLRARDMRAGDIERIRHMLEERERELG